MSQLSISWNTSSDHINSYSLCASEINCPHFADEAEWYFMDARDMWEAALLEQQQSSEVVKSRVEGLYNAYVDLGRCFRAS
jgi:hypothetical protein